MALGPDCCNFISDRGVSALFAGVVGGVAASWVCPPIGFLGGALFGIGVTVGAPLADTMLQIVCADPRDPRLNETAKTAMWAIALFAGLAAGWALVVAAGLPLSFVASLWIGVAMIPAAMLVACFCPCIVPRDA